MADTPTQPAADDLASKAPVTTADLGAPPPAAVEDEDAVDTTAEAVTKGAQSEIVAEITLADIMFTKEVAIRNFTGNQRSRYVGIVLIPRMAAMNVNQMFTAVRVTIGVMTKASVPVSIGTL